LLRVTPPIIAVTIDKHHNRAIPIRPYLVASNQEAGTARSPDGPEFSQSWTRGERQQPESCYSGETIKHSRLAGAPAFNA